MMPVGLFLAVNTITKLLNPGAPSYVRPLLDTKAGHYMLMAGAFMQIMGFLVVRKIVDIEV